MLLIHQRLVGLRTSVDGIWWGRGFCHMPTSPGIFSVSWAHGNLVVRGHMEI